MKRVLIGLAVLLLLAVAAVVISIDQIATRAIERGATHALGVDTSVGFVALSPFGGELHVKELRVANPSGFEGRYFVTFDSFELKADVGSLRSPVVHVPLFQLEGVDVSLERRGRSSNTDAILANLKRFEQKPGAKRDPEAKGPEKRFVVSRLVIKDVDAHVEWNDLAARESALDVKIDGIALDHPGGDRGLTLPELSNVVIKAVLDSVRRSGQLPAAVARDLAGGLRGLTSLPLAITGGVLEGAGELLPGPAGDVLDAAGGVVHGAGDLVGKGFDKLLGEKEK